jgi:GT2 family glycosyltransferase
VLAVDNASTDGSIDVIRNRFPDVRAIRMETNRGFAGGCNVAAAVAETDVVVFLNQDVRLEDDWLLELMKPLEADSQVVASQSLVLLYDTPSLVNTTGTTVNFLGIGWVTDYRKSADDVVGRDVDFLSGTAFAIRHEAFLDIGGFDERYGSYHEDVDLSWRMNLVGLRAVLAPRSRLYHKYRFIGPTAKNRALERNRLMTLFKNYRAGTLALILPALLLAEFGICCLALAQGWMGEKLAGYRDLIQLIPEIRVQRQRVQAIRRVGDRQIARKLVGGIYFVEASQPLVQVGGTLLAGYWSAIRRLINW